MLDALGHPVRRRLLVALTDHNPQQVHEAFLTEESSALDQDERETIALVHNHLPKLSEYGYITVDDDGNINRGPNWDDIGPMLRVLCDNESALPDDWLNDSF